MKSPQSLHRLKSVLLKTQERLGQSASEPTWVQPDTIKGEGSPVANHGANLELVNKRSLKLGKKLWAKTKFSIIKRHILNNESVECWALEFRVNKNSVYKILKDYYRNIVSNLISEMKRWSSAITLFRVISATEDFVGGRSKSYIWSDVKAHIKAVCGYDIPKAAILSFM